MGTVYVGTVCMQVEHVSFGDVGNCCHSTKLTSSIFNLKM